MVMLKLMMVELKKYLFNFYCYIMKIIFFFILFIVIILITKNNNIKKSTNDREKKDELHFKNLIKTNLKTDREVFNYLISPYSGYLFADYYIGSEIQDDKININLSNKKNLKYIENYDKIKYKSIIMCQNNYLSDFVDNILPNINKKIILITGQVLLPQLKKNSITDKVIKNNKIILWFCQNPIAEYKHISKYQVFPYGLKPYWNSMVVYYNFLKSVDNFNNKNIYISNLYSTVHTHLPENHIRKKYPIFSSSKKLSYNLYLSKILSSKFLISTNGDRDDCYRHYEAIGLNTVPISNIGFLYKRIFGKNMIYLTESELLESVNKKSGFNFKGTNRDLITCSYWRDWINKKINSIS
jgi:hypothetical protein